MEIEIFNLSQDSSTAFSNAPLAKGHLNQVDKIICIIFSYVNTGFFIKGQMQRNLDNFPFLEKSF